MSLHVTCPNCHFPYVLPSQQAGQRFTCTACDTEFELPSAASVEAGARLPPAQATPRYQEVIGDQTPVALEVIGVPSAHNIQSLEADALHSFWSFRHVFLLVGVITVTVVCLVNETVARRSAPVYLGVGIICGLVGYLIAVQKAASQLADGEPRGGNVFERLLVHPYVLLVGDPRASVSALRAFFLGGCLMIGAMVLAMRVGAMDALVPTFRLAAHGQQAAGPISGTTIPATVTLFPDVADSQPDGAATAPAEQQETAATGASKEAAATSSAKRRVQYTSPPPPPDE